MKSILNSVFFIILICSPSLTFGQLEEKTDFAEPYYLFPIKPGEQNTLAGTMGELRSSHFHTGIDIRTEGRTGLPVYAAADGYISRAVISTSGYGNALYILHPNGHTTAYAHLEKFEGEIADYMLEQQYARQIFKIDKSLPKGMFKVKKGDQIAWSGNSGSSGGPHLHFDIRDANQRPLNPLSFGFKEILDRTPPVAQKILLRTLDINARVEGIFGQKEYALTRIGNNYKYENPIYATGQIGLLLDAHDKLDYSRFRCGINSIKVWVNGKQSFKQTIERFAFTQQREIYRHMSYEDLKQKGRRYHKLYVDDGNKLHFYNTDLNDGKLLIEPSKRYDIKIEMTDTYQNSSSIEFSIEGRNEVNSSPYFSKASDYSFLDNTLILNIPNEKQNKITFNGETLTPDYTTASISTFLVDMREELPKVLEVNNEFTSFDYKDIIPHEVRYTYYDNDVEVYFQKESLFDTLFLESNYLLDSSTNKEYWTIGSELSPLRKSVKITLKSKAEYDKQKFQVYQQYDNGALSYEGGSWSGNEVSFWTRSFGTFTIATDSLEPSITPVRINSTELIFRIRDDLSGIKSFNCYVNDQWVLMHYDYKRQRLWSEKLDKKQPFKGEIKLIVTDMVNNEAIYTSTINE